MNRSGPRQEPWGIPQVTILADDLCPSTVQNCFLLRTYEVNQSPVIPLMPYFSSFANKMMWSTLSNVFSGRENSKVHFFLSMVEYQESALFIKDVIVEYSLRKQPGSL